MDNERETDADGSERKWRRLDAFQRRVAGVLIEKGKTTPDAYPLTLNALTTGCNQKSNRSPQMDLGTDDVELTLEELREMGAVGEIQGGGRAAKYRHYLYDWLGVDKIELSVIGELLLRGAQTVGELRGRAARMDPIPDLGTLKPILGSLQKKGLVISLTPEGRGQVVSHTLCSERELEELKREYQVGGRAAAASPSANKLATTVRPTPPPTNDLAELRDEIKNLQQELKQLQQRVHTLETRSG